MDHLTSIQCRHERRGYRLDARRDRAGAADDAGARLFLRRAGALEERAQHDDDELRRARLRRPWPGRSLGYSLAFAPGGRLVGALQYVGLRGVGLEAQGTIPHLLFMAYQGTFAIITAALISGAIVERMRFGAYLAFIALWTLVVYAPVAHWVWGGGWLAGDRRARLRRRHGRARQRRRPRRWSRRWSSARARTTARQAMLPHNVPFTLLGAGLLWFGWFGFNAGSALRREPDRRARVRRTRCSRPAATLVVWTLLDLPRGGTRHRGRRRDRASSSASSSITPAAGFVGPDGALAIGALGGVPELLRAASSARARGSTTRSTSSPRTALGGAAGALLTGVFAERGVERRRRRAALRPSAPARRPGRERR